MTLWVCPEYQTVAALGYRIRGDQISRLSTGEAPAVTSEETALRSAAAMVMNFMAVVGVLFVNGETGKRCRWGIEYVDSRVGM